MLYVQVLYFVHTKQFWFGREITWTNNWVFRIKLRYLLWELNDLGNVSVFTTYSYQVRTRAVRIKIRKPSRKEGQRCSFSPARTDGEQSTKIECQTRTIHKFAIIAIQNYFSPNVQSYLPNTKEAAPLRGLLIAFLAAVLQADSLCQQGARSSLFDSTLCFLCDDRSIALTHRVALPFCLNLFGLLFPRLRYRIIIRIHPDVLSFDG